MKVLMYGWEFPPKNSGGLGVACHGIVHGLLDNNTEVNLVLPYMASQSQGKFQIINSSPTLKKYRIASTISAYQTPKTHLETYINNKNTGQLYSSDLFTEVKRYQHEAGSIAKDVDHDVIHAHDWMTYPAAIEAKKHSGKPFIAHIHATEKDRSGENPHPLIHQIEKMGFEHADQIIAVSEFTKQKIIEHYQVDPTKIVVIHNAVANKFAQRTTHQFRQGQNTVLFLGRITMQKGPEYYLGAAKRVLELEPQTNFLMAGSGDMMAQMINYSIELGIEKNVIFTGFLRGQDIDRAFQSADVFVMPSVSEPFGIAALEAIANGTPVIVSKQSGVNEVIPNMLNVDFWDTEEMANKIIAVLRNPALQNTLREHATHDLQSLDWSKQAKKIKDLYHNLSQR